MADSLNWAGNLKYGAAIIHYPEKIEEIQELVNKSRNVKALGTRHSFNDIADSPGDLISLKNFKDISIDRKRSKVIIEAGIRYGELSKYLDREGYALSNMASLPHISVVGSCVTATHGSGDNNRSLSSVVSEMEFINGSGEMSFLSDEKNKKEFSGAAVNLGGLGIITKLTLDIIPAFEMRQDVYRNLHFKQLEDHFDEISSSAYSMSLFTDWRSKIFNQVWLKSRVLDKNEPKSEFFGAKLAKNKLHPIENFSAENCTEQMGIPGPSYERLPHFRTEFTPSSGEELQSEYLIPRKNALRAISAVSDLHEQIVPLIQISEIRIIAQDNLWMSPFYKQDCIGIHFTWKKNWTKVRKLLPKIEEKLDTFDARPHWSKLFTISPNRIQSLYKKLPDFQKLLIKYDPQEKFRNKFINTYIFDSVRPWVF